MPGKVPSWSKLDKGIADFSDTVEALYIFDPGEDSSNISKFVIRYVTNPNGGVKICL